MSEIMTLPADRTAVIELPSTYPFGPAVSWRMVHGSGWAISLRIRAPLTQSALFHWSFFCLQFQSLSVFGLPSTGCCNDRDRSRLHLVGKWSMPYLAGRLSLYILQQDNWCFTVDQHCLEGFRDMVQAVPLCHSQPHVHITSCNSTCLCLYFTKTAPGQDAKLYLNQVNLAFSKERAPATFLAIQWWWKVEQDRWRLLYQIPSTAKPRLCSVILPSENLRSSSEPCLDDHPHFLKHAHGFNPAGPRKAYQSDTCP